MRSIKIIKLKEENMGNELVIACVIFPSSPTPSLKDLFVRPCQGLNQEGLGTP